MQEIKKMLSLPKMEYYRTHLSLINCILPVKMTPKEIEVLATFMSLEGDIASYRFGTSGRRIVMNTLGIAHAGLSNYLRSLTDKEFLSTTPEGITKILPILYPETHSQDYRFRLIKKKEEETYA